MSEDDGTRLPVWKYFWAGGTQNTAHKRAYCLACLAQYRPDDVAHSVDHYMGINKQVDKDEEWFKNACATLEANDTGVVRGEKSAMIAHLAGKRQKCKHASEEARDAAIALRDGIAPSTATTSAVKRPADGIGAGDGQGSKKPRTAAHGRVNDAVQAKLKVFRGVDVPFSKDQIETIHAQFLRATLSANLPYRWVEDPEVIILFTLFRSLACDAMPSREVLSERLLDNADDDAEKEIKLAIGGQNVTLSTDGWKDQSKNAVAGVNASRAGDSRLVEVLRTNADAKDGPSMCAAFKGMIDRAEEKYGCTAIGFCTDGDGGSAAGRGELVEERPWLLESPCIGHQAQLIVADYFRESTDGALAAEQAHELIGWIWNHTRVREIFDVVQKDTSKGPAALSYLVSNLTRWTTHMISFHRLLSLRTPIQRAVFNQQDEIVAAQVGAAKGKKKKELESSARAACRIVLDTAFWDRLELAANDLEPIAYLTNIGQTDSTRPDQVLLGLAGIYLYFASHQVPAVRSGMTKRIEGRWKALDQALFLFSLVLNPYEGVQRFGDKAALNIFVLDGELLTLYRRCKSRPPPESLTTAQLAEHEDNKLQKESEVSAAFLQYMADQGPWKDFRQREVAFARAHNHDPIMVWRQMLAMPDVRELADFAIMLLEFTCHQGGLERVFSDMGIKKSKLRNRLGLRKVAKMSKVHAQIRREHKEQGFVAKRSGRRNHKASRVEQLLAVPRYADALDGEPIAADSGAETAQTQPTALVTSAAAWRRELARWKEAAEDDELHARAEGSRRNKGLFPRSLALLFGGTAKRPATIPPPAERRTRWSKEQLMMELLQAEHDDEDPDDGALEGSGDEYEP